LAGAITLVQLAGMSFVDVAILPFLLLGFMKNHPYLESRLTIQEKWVLASRAGERLALRSHKTAGAAWPTNLAP
jgi:hypothetical protein